MRDGVEQDSEWDKRWQGPEDQFVVLFITDDDKLEDVNYDAHMGAKGVSYEAHPNLAIITRSEQECFYGTAPLRRRDLLHAMMAGEYIASAKTKVSAIETVHLLHHRRFFRFA